ncbi:MAG: phage tail tape measure protein, partial [Sulfurovum sp.]|nr:phage tail tape measure protein [Sulfurovum sp.]
MDKLMTLGIALTALDNFSKPMAKVQESLGSFAKKAGRINVDALKKSIEDVREKTNRLNHLKVKLEHKLKRTKTNSDGLKRSIARVDAQLGKLNKRKLSLSQSLKRARYDSDLLNKKMQRLGLTLSKYGALSAAAGRMATGKLMDTVSAFKEVQKAQGDIASLGIDTDGIDKITASAKKMSKQYAGVTMPEFIRASYDIKSGIASLSSEGVAKFTEFAAMTGRATKSTTEEMTKLFALGYGIFKRTDETDMEFGERFSASIATAVQAFRTDGNDLTLGLSNIGAVAKKMRVSLSEELAVIGNAKDAFNSASEAGTAYRSFLSNAVQAQEKLGISLTDTSWKLLPMRMILEQVRKKFGDLDAMEMKQLKEAFGSDEAVKIITALMDKTDNLAASERKLASAKMSTVEAMAKSRNKGHEFTLMMQKLSVLSSTIGKKLSPVFDAVAGKIAVVADKLERFVNSPLGKWTVYAVTGLSALALTLGAVGLAAGAFAAYIGYAGKALALFKLFGTMATTGMLLLQAAMSPIVLTVAAIAAAVYLIIDNWSGMSRWFGTLWSSVVDTFKQASEWIGKLITDPIGTISLAWSNLAVWFGGFWSSVTGVFASGANYIAKIFTDPTA